MTNNSASPALRTALAYYHAWLKRRTAAINLRNLLGKGLAAATAPGSWPPDRAAVPAGNQPLAKAAQEPEATTEIRRQRPGPAG